MRDRLIKMALTRAEMEKTAWVNPFAPSGAARQGARDNYEAGGTPAQQWINRQQPTQPRPGATPAAGNPAPERPDAGDSYRMRAANSQLSMAYASRPPQ